MHATCGDGGAVAPAELPIPGYLEQLYWWAYVHPAAVRLFERPWLVNLILLGNYRRLGAALLRELGGTACGRTLQVGCVYGNLTARIQRRLGAHATLDVIDVLPIQLGNLARKLAPDPRVRLRQGDAAALPYPAAHFDRVLLFFLLHEQPDAVRRASLAEALRVVRPGGRVIVIDYHRPRLWHPLHLPMRLMLRALKPHAAPLWRQPLRNFLPATPVPVGQHTETFFGGLYQKVVLLR